MRILSFEDQRLSISDWLFVLACYVLPIVTLLFLPVLWFLFPIFVCVSLLSRLKLYLLRFHLMQSLLCFLAFMLLIMALVLLSGANANQAFFIALTLIVTALAVICNFLLLITTIVLLSLRRYFRLPGLGGLAEKFANKPVAL